MKSADVEKVFYAELDSLGLRQLLINRTQDLLSQQELANFRSCQPGDKSLQPLCLYDVARRLPLVSSDPMFHVGEFFSMLLSIRQNYMQIMGTQTANNMQLASRFAEIVVQLIQEVAVSILNHDLQGVSLEKLEPQLLRAFPPSRNARVPNTQTPTQQDIKNLEELLFQIPSHHGRAVVFGAFLREVGTDPQLLIQNGNQFDLDFTTMPAQQFWVLYEICQKYAPGAKK